jgi:hypothetical protein
LHGKRIFAVMIISILLISSFSLFVLQLNAQSATKKVLWVYSSGSVGDVWSATHTLPDGTTFTVKGFWEQHGFSVDLFETVFGDTSSVTLASLQSYSAIILPNLYFNKPNTLQLESVFEQYVNEGGGLIYLGQNADPAWTLDEQLGFHFLESPWSYYVDAVTTDSSHPVMSGITELPKSGGAFVDWDTLIAESPLPTGVRILARSSSGSTNNIALIAFQHGQGKVVVGPCDGMMRPYGPTTVNGLDVASGPVIENKLIINALNWVSSSTGSTDQNQLVAHWSFDEGSGSTAADSSGNGNAGTLVNSPQWVNGISGNALLFSGSNNVAVPSSTSLAMSGGAAMTLEGWIKPSAAIDSSTLLLTVVDYGNKYGFQASGTPDSSGGISIGFFVDTTKYGTSSPRAFSTTKQWNVNTWYYIVGTYDGSNIKIYVNGELETTVQSSGTLTGNAGYPLSIGSYYQGGRFYFAGTIDEVKIYNYARTPQQIADDHNGITPTVTPTPTPTPSTNLVSGLENVVTFSAWTTDANIPFTIQQNFYISNPAGLRYWVQNCILLARVEGQIYNGYGGFEIYNWTNGGPPSDFVEYYQWIAKNKLLAFYFTFNLAPLKTENQMILRSMLNNGQLELENSFHSQYVWDKLSDESFSIDNIPSKPEIVFVGNTLIKQVSFVAPTNGHVDSYLRMGNNPPSWYNCLQNVIPVQAPDTVETSNGLMWTNSGDFQFTVNSADQGLSLSPNISSSATPPGVQEATLSTNAAVFIMHSPANMSLYDPSGRHTGYNTSTGKFDFEIPNSLYLLSNEQSIVVFDPPTTFKMVITGTSTGNYTLDQYALDSSTQLLIWSRSGETQAGKVEEFDLATSSVPETNQGQLVPMGVIYAILVVLAIAIIVVSAVLIKRNRFRKRL